MLIILMFFFLIIHCNPNGRAAGKVQSWQLKKENQDEVICAAEQHDLEFGKASLTIHFYNSPSPCVLSFLILIKSINNAYIYSVALDINWYMFCDIPTESSRPNHLNILLCCNYVTRDLCFQPSWSRKPCTTFHL